MALTISHILLWLGTRPPPNGPLGLKTGRTSPKQLKKFESGLKTSKNKTKNARFKDIQNSSENAAPTEKKTVCTFSLQTKGETTAAEVPQAPESYIRRSFGCIHSAGAPICDFSAPQTSPQRISALAGISEPPRGPTVAVGIIGHSENLPGLPRRLPPGSRLWLVFPSPREGRQ